MQREINGAVKDLEDLVDKLESITSGTFESFPTELADDKKIHECIDKVIKEIEKFYPGKIVVPAATIIAAAILCTTIEKILLAKEDTN